MRGEVKVMRLRAASGKAPPSQITTTGISARLSNIDHAPKKDPARDWRSGAGQEWGIHQDAQGSMNRAKGARGSSAMRKAAAGLRSAAALLSATAPRRLWKDLFQRRVDGVELTAQVGTDAVDGRNNSQRNTGCDQPVFNGSGAGFVCQETCKKFGHAKPLLK